VSDPRDLERARLPREFVVKPNHASGAVWIVSDVAVPVAAALPPATRGWGTVLTRPDELDWNMLVACSQAWLSRNFGDEMLEWAYRDIRPRILVEELLHGSDGRVPPNDYKFFVFHGRVRLVKVTTDRHGAKRGNFFLPDWSPLDVRGPYPRADTETPRPLQLERMVDVAEALGVDTDFVRVDLYETSERVVFGELTNYPDGGRQKFTPSSFDLDLGQWWEPPRRYARRGGG
jgi:TupA-like ATPgrasp